MRSSALAVEQLEARARAGWSSRRSRRSRRRCRSFDAAPRAPCAGRWVARVDGVDQRGEVRVDAGRGALVRRCAVVASAARAPMPSGGSSPIHSSTLSARRSGAASRRSAPCAAGTASSQVTTSTSRWPWMSGRSVPSEAPQIASAACEPRAGELGRRGPAVALTDVRLPLVQARGDAAQALLGVARVLERQRAAQARDVQRARSRSPSRS